MPRVYYETTSVPVVDDYGEPSTLVISTAVVVCGPPGSPEQRREPTYRIDGATTRQLSATEFETTAGRHWRTAQRRDARAAQRPEFADPLVKKPAAKDAL